MTKEELINGNKIIAEFMGAILHPEWTTPVYKDPYPTFDFGDNRPTKHSSRHWCFDDLYYHEDWNWIMPVIRKINGLGKEYSLAIFKNYVSCTVEKGGKFYKDFSFSHAEYITSEQDDITAAFKLVVKFVEWYNLNVKAKEVELKTNE